MRYISVCSGVEAASLATEEWRDIAGLEGVYQVSNLGYVRRLNCRKNKQGNGGLLKIGRFRTGYCRVSLPIEGRRKCVSVHRLVAKAFVPNPNNLPCVNHKDENKANNKSTNLEWCDHRYNNTYGNRMRNVAKAMSVPIIAIASDGSEKEYAGLSDCARKLGINTGKVCEVLHGIRKHTHGYTFKYAKEGA